MQGNLTTVLKMRLNKQFRFYTNNANKQTGKEKTFKSQLAKRNNQTLT